MELHEGDTKEVLEYIGIRVRKARKAKYSNYVNFAREFGLNRATVFNIETGKDFKMSNLIKILLALEVGFEDLFSRIDFEVLYDVTWERRAAK